MHEELSGTSLVQAHSPHDGDEHQIAGGCRHAVFIDIRVGGG